MFSSTASSGDSHRLSEGLDGLLFGTTEADGPLANSGNFGTIFSLGKDGSGYMVLHAFGVDGTLGGYPGAGLARDQAGVLYGITYDGAEGAFGVVYRLLPPETPEMLGVTRTNNSTQILFSGTPGYQYQLLRSTDLTAWSTLNPVTMPASGTFTNLDSAAPSPNAFYRAVWVP